MDRRPDDKERRRVVAALVPLLANRPAYPEDLVEQLVDVGVPVDLRRLVQIVVSEPRMAALPDRRFLDLVSFADDLVLTHRLIPEECRLGLVSDADLRLWSRLTTDGWPLAAGGLLEVQLRHVAPDIPRGFDAALRGPAGWLDGFAPCDLLGLRLKDGLLHVEHIQLPAESEWLPTAARIARVAHVHVTLAVPPGAVPSGAGATGRAGQPASGPPAQVPLPEIVLGFRSTYPTGFVEPVPPLTELAEWSSLPLEVHHGSVGAAGAAWHGEDARLVDTDRKAVSEWAALLAAAGAPQPRVPDPEALADLAARLASPAALPAAADRGDRRPSTAAAMADAMATALAAGPFAGDGRLRAVPAYLRARSADALGQVRESERWLRRALDDDPDNVPTLRGLAALESARGDAVEALRLHERAGTSAGYRGRNVLAAFTAPPPPDPRRDEPCPCGSGRTRGDCHDRIPRHPLPRRAEWLFVKLMEFAGMMRHRETLIDFAEILRVGATDGPPQAHIEHLMVLDLAVFDGGIVEAFLAERGDLLPDDERALAQSWLDAPLRVLETRALSDAGNVVFTDLRDGQRIDLDEESLAVSLERLDLICCRPLPDGTGGWHLGHPAVLLPRPVGRFLGRLLARDHRPEEVAAWFARTHGPIPWRGVPGLDSRGRLASGFPTVELLGEDALPSEEELVELEENWCVTPCGPLGGWTPQQAAADPHKREELDHVLDDMEWLQRHGAVPAFHTDRLRSRLGLA